MKNFLLALLILPVLCFTACGDDEDANDDNFGEVTLRHDGANVTGPFLPAGIHQFLVRFDAVDLRQYEGRRLDRVEFYLGEVPSSLGVVVLNGTNPNFPDQEIFYRDITNRINGTGWITHRLNEDVFLTDNDLWLAIEVTHDQEQRSVGCDAGPRDPGGDWLLRQQDDDYVTFGEISTESVNWNIRGVLAPEGE